MFSGFAEQTLPLYVEYKAATNIFFLIDQSEKKIDNQLINLTGGFSINLFVILAVYFNLYPKVYL